MCAPFTRVPRRHAWHNRPVRCCVPLVEEGWFDHRATELVAEEYLSPLRTAGISALVLGCTHYPLLKPLLQRIMGNDVTLIDSAAETASALAQVLHREGLEAPARSHGDASLRGER